MAGDKIHEYESDAIQVQYSLKRCIHAEECVRRLSAVFNKRQRPWIQPQKASAGEIAETIHQCPTGALHYVRKDGGAAEQPDNHSTLHTVPDGPLYIRGDITLKSTDGTVLMQESRLALCRCGASKNKPFCDNSHHTIEFKTVDKLAENLADSVDTPGENGTLTVAPESSGPYHIEGDFTIYSADNTVEFRGHDAWLCRCGGSANKPFCDSTHKKIGFDAP